MLYYILFWTLLGFIIHFYIIFGTNLLTGGPAQNCYFFCLFQYFDETEYQTESKRNETFRKVILEQNQSRELGVQARGSSRMPRDRGGAPTPPGAPSTLVGPSWLPWHTSSAYISPYTLKRWGHNRSGVPPSEASVATKSQPRPVLAPCRRGNPSPVAIFIIPVHSMTRRE